MFEKDNYASQKRVVITKVIGIGGGGNNAVNCMIEDGLQGVDFYVANTDEQVLQSSIAKNKLILGKSVTKGLGAGADPELGRKAALESEAEIREILKGAHLVFVAAGMGGGTGTGAAPIVAKIAKELGALTIGIVNRPFSFEGKQRHENALAGIEELKKNVDSLIVVSNDRLLQNSGNLPIKESFREADSILRQSVQSITDLIAGTGFINLDFADIRNVMENKGLTMIGFGIACGESRAKDAATKALASSLLEASIHGAKKAIVNVTGGTNITLNEANDAIDIIREASSRDLNILLGMCINDNLEDEMIVTLIATEFDESRIEDNPGFKRILETTLSNHIDRHKNNDDMRIGRSLNFNDINKDDADDLVPTFMMRTN